MLIYCGKPHCVLSIFHSIICNDHLIDLPLTIFACYGLLLFQRSIWEVIIFSVCITLSWKPLLLLCVGQTHHHLSLNHDHQLANAAKLNYLHMNLRTSFVCPLDPGHSLICHDLQMCTEINVRLLRLETTFLQHGITRCPRSQGIKESNCGEGNATSIKMR